jgi:hypothetical protein
MYAADQIDRAIVAHAYWRQRLYFALAAGKCELTPEVVRSDRQCAFGEWLYGLPEEKRTSTHWKRVVALHVAFHELAGDTLTAVLAGRREEALHTLSLGGEFSQASARLVAALSHWRMAETADSASADDGAEAMDIVRFVPRR